MSANRDKTQKITFVYSNLYSIYRKGVEAAKAGAAESGPQDPSQAAQALKDLALPRTTSRSAQPFESGIVIKAGSPAADRAQALRSPAQPPAAPRVGGYTPAELIGKRVAKPASLVASESAPRAVAAKPSQAEAVASLKQNLQSLNDLQARLRFMLQELEELVKE